MAEGVKVAEELLQSGRIKVQAVYATEPWLLKKEPLIKQRPGLPVEKVTAEMLAGLSSLDTPNEVVLLCDMPQEETMRLEGKVSLLLDAIRDPGNLGTIVRIADWFGIEYVVCSPDCVDPFNAKAIQATMGSLARIKLPEASLADVMKAYAGMPAYAATLEGRPFAEFGKMTEGFLMIGNESHGISEALRRQATAEICIPRLGQAESLNAAVATGILCSHLLL